MVRKRRTDLPGYGEGSGEGSGSQESGMGRRGGAHHSPSPQQQGGGPGRGWVSANPQHQGGRGGGYYQGRGGGHHHVRGGQPPRGGPPGRGEPQHYYGGPSGAAYVPGGRGAGPSAAELGGTPLPELHQATQPPSQAMPSSSQEASSLRSPVVTLTEQVEQLSLKGEPSAGQAIVPASSKSMRFPLRPGKGSCGARCVVKANHFFAELPDKDLHQYDLFHL
ncbi:hypothetical protein HPP92_008833 [Vanilla planifolia]|uniref:Uncharacterized protein n=1 Tax=Vanilla planifolia TaxID=51239 RepID=A0A835RI34_VANPL|nr:hypothetical protein HPP92_008833 [Vanilla planifolia]